jgi:hypothetical protein
MGSPPFRVHDFQAKTSVEMSLSDAARTNAPQIGDGMHC